MVGSTEVFFDLDTRLAAASTLAARGESLAAHLATDSSSGRPAGMCSSTAIANSPLTA
jgi:hypothetical protein